jgi:hypothetical protein
LFLNHYLKKESVDQYRIISIVKNLFKNKNTNTSAVLHERDLQDLLEKIKNFLRSDNIHLDKPFDDLHEREKQMEEISALQKTLNLFVKYNFREEYFRQKAESFYINTSEDPYENELEITDLNPNLWKDLRLQEAVRVLIDQNLSPQNTALISDKAREDSEKRMLSFVEKTLDRRDYLFAIFKDVESLLLEIANAAEPVDNNSQNYEEAVDKALEH